MRASKGSVALLVLAAAACDSPPATQPQSENIVNATASDQPVGPAADYAGGNVTPGEQGDIHAVEQLKPEQVVIQFANLLHHKRFGDAFQLTDSEAMGLSAKQFEERFSEYRTIDAAAGEVGRTEGAAGSLYSEVQLTLSGDKKNGSPYVMTGPVTLRRANDVPGASTDQLRWRIVNMALTSETKARQ